MFHMTNDSVLFRTGAQLETDGFYPVQGNRWKKGDELYLRLYQGRMIHQFDHRANSVRFNPESTHNPYLSEEVAEARARRSEIHSTSPVLGAGLHGAKDSVPESRVRVGIQGYRPFH